MDILIPDNWLREFLDTKADSVDIGKYLSLCGPSVQKIEKKNSDYIYHVEITTNRVDSAGVYGFAREAFAILPQFGIKANLKQPKFKTNQPFANKVDYLDVKVDTQLCPRFTAILIKNIKQKPSPSVIQNRLRDVGLKPINNIVDISNYIMHELGQPVHTFDYDKIKNRKMILRKSKSGERLTTLDGKTHILPGNDIVIEDGEGRLIDLAGIMGGFNSAVDYKTKNVLLFVQTYNPVNIRSTAMRLSHRTEASSLFEKGLDAETVTLGIKRGIDLFVELAGGSPANKILDIYKNPFKPKSVKLNHSYIENYLGSKIEKKTVAKILKSLGFTAIYKNNQLTTCPPSFRANDINIPEDIIEEIARIYGYHNIPSILMAGELPQKLEDSPFAFENKIKTILKSYGGIELYNISLVPKSYVNTKALSLSNPLGSDTKYLRTSLLPSLLNSMTNNLGIKESLLLFELANIYIPKKNSLPDERSMLGAIFNNDFREAKGFVEAMLEELNIDYKLIPKDAKYFAASKRVVIKNKKGSSTMGQLGVLEEGYVYFEFEVEKLRTLHNPISSYKTIPKYPAQIEDITLVLPERTRVGDVIQLIKSTSKYVSYVELTDIFKNSYTFRTWYQHPTRTLTDKDVENIRKRMLKVLKVKFGIKIKS